MHEWSADAHRKPWSTRLMSPNGFLGSTENNIPILPWSPFAGIRRNWCNSKQSTPETTGPAPAALQLVVTLWPIEARADWGFLYHRGAKASRAYTIDFHLIRHPENSQWEAGLSLHGQPKVRGSPGHTDVGNNTQWLLWPQKEHPVEGQAGQISNMSKKIWRNIFTSTRCSHGGQRI